MSRAPSAGRGAAGYADLPLLDKLLDAEPERAQGRPVAAAESVERLHRAVRRDVEALLNARRPWRSPARTMPALRLSPIGYGLADFTAGAFQGRAQREALRAEIEETIRRFEPRLAAVQVSLAEDGGPLRATLRLRVEGLLRVQPAPEPVAFDTAVDVTTADVTVRPTRVP